VNIIKEIKRLNEAGSNNTEIEKALGISRKTVRGYLQKLENLGLSFKDIEKLSGLELQRKLFPSNRGTKKKIQPCWQFIYQEYQKKNVTLQLLWYEFIDANPNGVGYSRFLKYFKEYCKTLNPSMRQIHNYGEKCFLDFAGQTMPITNPKTGEIKMAQIFVACLGASNYTFAFAVENQSLESWIYCHKKAFEFFGGVPKITVPDNLKAAVTKACRYDPVINKSYQDFAKHYDFIVIPARPRKPQDKAKVENAVQVVQRWILASLRNHTFFSIHELNQKISELLLGLNSKEFKKLDGNRKYLFEKFEKPLLKPLPQESFEFMTWKKARVNINYHIELEKHYYSVPHKYIRKEVELAYSINCVNIFFEGSLIAKHLRSFENFKYSTIHEHMPKNHQEYGSWNPERIGNWASSIGENTAELIQRVLKEKEHPALAYKACMGIIGFEKRFPKEKIEKASARLLEFGFNSAYLSMKKILLRGLEERSESFTVEKIELNFHENIRGAKYYQSEIKEENDDK
jgi:transposase